MKFNDWLLAQGRKPEALTQEERGRLHAVYWAEEQVARAVPTPAVQRAPHERAKRLGGIAALSGAAVGAAFFVLWAHLAGTGRAVDATGVMHVTDPSWPLCGAIPGLAIMLAGLFAHEAERDAERVASTHGKYNWNLGLFSLLLPPWGFLLGIICCANADPELRSAGMKYLERAIFGLFVWLVLIVVTFNRAQENARRLSQTPLAELEAGDLARAEQLEAMNRIEVALGFGNRMSQEQADMAYRDIQTVIAAYPGDHALRTSMEALYANFPPERLAQARIRWALTSGK